MAQTKETHKIKLNGKLQKCMLYIDRERINEGNPEAEYITGYCEHFDNIKTNIIPPSDNIELLCYHPLFVAASPIKKSLIYKLGGCDIS